jgi:hypothetical protein
MPINVTQGSCVEFTVVFFDSSGNTTVPSSGSLSIVYTDYTSGSTASSSISLVQSGSFFIGSWSSSAAALGFANWSVTAPGLANNPAESGQLRIIRP